MARAASSAADQQAHGHIVLLLSLKLILLAFFILLNAVSEFEEERTRAVLESVNRTFSGTIDALPRSTPAIGLLGALPHAQTHLSEVGSLFESLIPDSRSQQTERATMLRVELPAAALFDPGRDRVRPNRELLIRRLAKALRRDAGGSPSYTLEFLHEVPPSARGRIAAGGPAALEVRRAGALTARLIEQGLPPDALSIGLLPGRADMIQFVVRLRQEALAEDPPAEPGEQDR